MSKLSLQAFLIANREEILGRSRSKTGDRTVPLPTGSGFLDGLPLFLDQLIRILSVPQGDRASEHAGLTASATIHGEELLRRGLTVGQVVQDYGSICQSVTEVASERHAAITAEEFQLFNRCLDEAIAEAVTAYEHEREPASDNVNVTHLGSLAHEMRNFLGTSILSFDALRRGSVGVNGSTSAALGRSLQGMRALIDRTLADVRLRADLHTAERIVVAELIAEIEIIATLQAKARGIEVSIEPCAQNIIVDADRHILVAAVANIVQNACKFSSHGGRVSVSTRATVERVLIEVQDQCGGLPKGKAEELFLPFERRGANQGGLGLGLSISLRGVRASGGEIHVRDLPDRGCVFTIDLPRAPRLPTDAARLDVALTPVTPSPPNPSNGSAVVFLLPSLLIVDDDADIRSACEALLSSSYRVTLARDGAEALTALRDKPFDLALVDLELPIVDGLTVVRTIRARADHQAPAFLFLSGQANPRVRAEALALGDVDYMSKPVAPDELIAKLARILAAVTRENRLRADVMTDSLTGLANYRYFTRTLDREIERSRRYELPLSLVVLDLDHLKLINDQHGRDVGDDAIKLVANVIAKTVRSCELVARQGGDEFAVILPNTAASDARMLAVRLQESVSAQTILGVKLAASIGLVSWENRKGGKEHHVESAALLKSSEEALSRAKRSGRDRIESNQM